VAGRWTLAAAGLPGCVVIAGATRRPSALILSAQAGSPIGRRAAQQLARRELSRSIYAEPIQTRILHWLANLLSRIFDAANGFPGGIWTSAALLALAVLAAAAVTFWIRPGGLGHADSGPVLAGTALSARDLRQQAERWAEAGDFAAAIVEQVRAIAAEIEERGILPARPGRTADELAAQAGRAMPDVAGELTAVALLFDDVLYGGRAGTAAGYQRARSLDARVRAVRAAAPALPERAGPAWAVVP
jgi:hypothetical protein